ncbi:hypothetical protein G4228_020200 [Cervus hanglu yarkandensis]|uniref:Uncharacterized protein n=1 Tax=Cervus hanglu yarkandensis TaxID=84702 RepID=A0A833SGX2_9CERV|nr:hypothetical protein G4228_020200 [Cervus hanglu yarkandensis]
MSCGPSLVPGRLFMAGINLTENLHFVLIHPAWSLAPLPLRMGAGPVPGVSARGQRPGSAASYINTIAGDFICAVGFDGNVIRLNQKLLRG